MGGWMDRDRGMDRGMYGWMEGWVDDWIDEWMEGWMKIEGWIYLYMPLQAVFQ